MKRGFALILLLLASCIPKSEAPKRAPGRRLPMRSHAAMPFGTSPRGNRLPPAPDRTFSGGCSALGTVQLLEIETPVTNLGPMTCPLARQFARWAREAVQPAASQWLKGRIVRIESFGTYSCRPVNSQPGARLSEHGRSNAVDIAAFMLATGAASPCSMAGTAKTRMSAASSAPFTKRAASASRPASARTRIPFHANHFHFDMGRGPYCR
jgi:hypothetical protein